MRAAALAVVAATGCSAALEEPSPGPVLDTAWPDTGLSPDACRPDEEPDLSRAELPFDPAVVSRYRAAEVQLDPTGWDFRGVGSEALESSVQAPEGFWFAERYDGATHVAALDNAATAWAIYRADDDGLWLLGTASDTPSWTALTYRPAVVLWSWPLGVGQEQASEVAAEGLLDGQDYPYEDPTHGTIALTHALTLTAEERGQLQVDAGSYEALRVHLAFEAWATNSGGRAFGHQDSETWTFLSPCVGAVARITETEFAGLGL